MRVLINGLTMENRFIFTLTLSFIFLFLAAPSLPLAAQDAGAEPAAIITPPRAAPPTGGWPTL